jgi:hypothetical protein
MTYQRDYQFGKEQEKKILPIIINYFKEDIKPNVERYSTCDFESDTTIYELKSRNVNYKTYPTSIIAKDKINENKKNIFLFNFKDGLYYIEYNSELFNQFELKPFKRNERIDKIDIKKEHYFIPIEYLQLIPFHI